MFDSLASSFSSLFSKLTGQARLTESNIDSVFQSLRTALLDADVPYEVVTDFLQQVRADVIGQKITTTSLKPGEQFAKIVHDRLLAFLGGQHNIDFSFTIPARVVVVGLQGAGKTTMLAKLAYYTVHQAKKHGKQRKVLLASIDMYRPAAIDQLEVLAKTVGVDFYRSVSQNPVEAAREITKYAKDKSYDILLLDTAGRLQIDAPMMQELKDVVSLVQPTHKLLVVDGMIGQESLAVGKSFLEAVGFDYALLSKMDSDTRGGVAFAFRYVLQRSILFLGVGEKPEDLDLFRAERIARRMIGMGDLQGLIERAEEKIKDHEKEALEQSFKKNSLTLNDFAQHLDMVNRMGPLDQLIKQMPMFGGAKISPEMVQQGQEEMRKFKAIINSMTPKERSYPALLNTSRRERIARGAGVDQASIKVLLDRFEKSQQFVKLFKKLGRLPGLG